MLHGAVLRSPLRAREDPVGRHQRGRGAPEGARGDHRRDPRRTRPGLDADPVERHPGGAGHRQGALPGPGGRLRRRRRPLRRARRAGADRGRVRAARPGDRREDAPPTRRARSSATTRRGRPTTTSSTGSPATRARTDAIFAEAEAAADQRVVVADMLYPRVHPAPLETCGAIADMDPVTGKLTLWTTTQAPHAHRTLYALVAGLPEHKIRIISPDIGGGFGNKVGIYPGYVCAVVGLDRHRPAGEVDGGPLREPHEHLVRPRLPHARRGGGHRGRPAARGAGARARRPRRVQRHGAAHRVPGRVLRGVHRLVRPRGRPLRGHRRLHQQGAPAVSRTPARSASPRPST